MKYCYKCGKTNVDGAAFCKYCGTELVFKDRSIKEKENKKGNKKLIGIIAGVAAGAFAAAIVTMTLIGGGLFGLEKARPAEETQTAAVQLQNEPDTDAAMVSDKDIVPAEKPGSADNEPLKETTEETSGQAEKKEAPEEETQKEKTQEAEVQETKVQEEEVQKAETQKEDKDSAGETEQKSDKKTRKSEKADEQEPEKETEQEVKEDSGNAPTVVVVQLPAQTSVTVPARTSDPAPAVSPVTVLYPNSGATNVRTESDYNSSIAGTISGDTAVYYYGYSEPGYGKDGLIHTWYYVQTSDGLAGWIRSDLLSEKKTEAYQPSYASSYPTAYANGLNLRADHSHYSGKVTNVTGTVYLLGDEGYGPGSDDVTHRWVLVRTTEGIEGWARADLLE